MNYILASRAVVGEACRNEDLTCVRSLHASSKMCNSKEFLKISCPILFWNRQDMSLEYPVVHTVCITTSTVWCVMNTVPCKANIWSRWSLWATGGATGLMLCQYRLRSYISRCGRPGSCSSSSSSCCCCSGSSSSMRVSNIGSISRTFRSPAALLSKECSGPVPVPDLNKHLDDLTKPSAGLFRLLDRD